MSGENDNQDEHLANRLDEEPQVILGYSFSELIVSAAVLFIVPPLLIATFAYIFFGNFLAGLVVGMTLGAFLFWLLGWFMARIKEGKPIAYYSHKLILLRQKLFGSNTFIYRKGKWDIGRGR